MVIQAWKEALPEAEIVVFDNNSRDGTGRIARELGVTVIPVREQGKGHAVRCSFRELADRDVVILVDGDGTYPADRAMELVEPIVADLADMTVGARKPVEPGKSMSPVRTLGNVLIRLSFAVLIGQGPGDLLSGYRARQKGKVEVEASIHGLRDRGRDRLRIGCSPLPRR